MPRRPSKKKKVIPCAKCGKPSSEFHHITYRPVSGKRLCNSCHRAITICNVNAADAIRRKLTNKHRWYIWSGWLRGEIQPVMTPAAERWLATWRPSSVVAT